MRIEDERREQAIAFGMAMSEKGGKELFKRYPGKRGQRAAQGAQDAAEEWPALQGLQLDEDQREALSASPAAYEEGEADDWAATALSQRP